MRRLVTTVLGAMCFASAAGATEYTVLVPTVQHRLTPPMIVPDYAGAIEVVLKNIELGLASRCARERARVIESAIWEERRKVSVKQRYIVATRGCELIGVVPADRDHLWAANTTIQYIDLYPLMTLPSGREF